MNRALKTGVVAATVCTALTLGACATDGYYGYGGGYYSGYYSGYYPYATPYLYPSSSISLYYSSPRYYRYYRHRYPYYRNNYYRYRGHHYYGRPGHYYGRPGRYYGGRGHYYGRPGHYNRPARPAYRTPSYHRPAGGHRGRH